MELPFDLTTAAGILASKDLVTKILGPTAEYIGGEMKHLVERCNVNVGRIFARAATLLGEELEQDGAVNSRVLRAVVYEGAFCEDEVTADYLAGILAAGRTSDGKDDRGVGFAALLKEMSAYQVRLHHLFYSVLHECTPTLARFSLSPHSLESLSLKIGQSLFTPALAFRANTPASVTLQHSVIGLARQSLIDPRSSVYDISEARHANEFVINLIPSLFGAELFLWVNGYRDASAADFFRVERRLRYEQQRFIRHVEFDHPSIEQHRIHDQLRAMLKPFGVYAHSRAHNKPAELPWAGFLDDLQYLFQHGSAIMPVRAGGLVLEWVGDLRDMTGEHLLDLYRRASDDVVPYWNPDEL